MPTPQGVSRQIRRAVESEARLWAELKDLQMQLDALPAPNKARLDVLRTVSAKNRDYLDALFLMSIPEDYRDKTYNELYFKLRDIPELEEVRAEWTEELRAHAAAFLARQDSLTITLPSWDFAELTDLTEDIHYLVRSGNNFTIPPRTDLQAVVDAMFTTPKAPAITNKIDLIFVEDSAFGDTRSECRRAILALDDPTCRQDAAAACGVQMDRECVAKVLKDFKQADCRKRNVTFGGSAKVNKTKRSNKTARPSSAELTDALVACDFKAVILK